MRNFAFSCLRVILLFGTVFADIASEETAYTLLKPRERHSCSPNDCGKKPSPMHVTVRHIDPGGIGYNHGYTTLEGFFALHETSYVPFIDLRGHVFNDGRFAANAGFGLRWVSGCRSYGFNSYYDYRKARHQHYNQIGMGLESIGELFDVFINGYLPVGDKKSPYFAKHSTTLNELSGEDFAFDFFSGNHLFLSTQNGSIRSTTITRQKVEFALKGIEGFFRFTWPASNDFFVSAGAGPYYFQGDYAHHAVGGKGILSASWKEYITASVTGSYDTLFHGRLQGELGFTWPFGPKGNKERRNDRGASCAPLFSQKLVSSPVINEIIVLDTHHSKKKTVTLTSHTDVTVIAINPATGLPFEFWFVDNTSSSAGTFESPFQTLLAAQNASSPNDVIYVFGGDGTSKGMDAGIVLKNSQMLLGASIPHTLVTTQGTIVIPPQGNTTPSLTAPPGSSVVTLANDNNISGFQITADAAGLLIGSYCIGSYFTDTVNLAVSQNTLTANNGAIAIVPRNPSGQIAITDNIIQSTDLKGTYGLYFAQLGGAGVYNIENNQISKFQNTDIHRSQPPQIPLSSAIVVLAQNGAHIDTLIAGNQITECAGNDIDLRAIGAGNSFLSAQIENNQLLQGSPDTFGMFLFTDTTAVQQFTMLNNQIDECLFGAIAQAEGNSQMTGLIQNNVVSNVVGGSGFILQTNALDMVGSATGQFTVLLNDVSVCDAQGVALGSSGSSSLTATVENNQLHSMGKAGVYALSFNSSKSNLTILNNTIHDNNGGMEIDPVDDSTLNLVLQGNTIYNNNDAGLFTHATQNGIGKYAILSNTFYNNNTLSGNTGSAITMIADDSSNLCLRLLNNQASMEDPPDYFLEKMVGPSVFDLEPEVGNTGTSMKILITPVPAGFCGP